MVEDEQKARDEARESQAKAERNANKLSAELEEIRAQLEQVSLFIQYSLGHLVEHLRAFFYIFLHLLYRNIRISYALSILLRVHMPF